MSPRRPGLPGGIAVCAWLALSGGATAAPPELSPTAYALYDAASQGDTTTVRNLLLDTPALARTKFKADVTALHAAALADEPRTVELLIRRGAYVDARGGQQSVTPLFLAVMKQHPRVVAALLANRADPNARGSVPGDSGAEIVRPLHVAALGGRADIVELLIESGAMLKAISSTGASTADYARRGGSPAVAMILAGYDSLGLTRGRPVAEFILAVESGDSLGLERALKRQPRLVNARLDAGWTPLHLAASAGSQSACDVLLAHGANPVAIEPGTGWTPALRAYNSGHTELCEYLRTREPGAATPKP